MSDSVAPSDRRTAVGADADGRLAGAVAIITGGGTGIGRATALRFADEGASVAVLGNVGADCAATAAAITERGGLGTAIPVDVAESREVNEAIDHVVRDLGPPTVVVNSAGIGPADDGPADALDDAIWWQVLRVNLGGTFLMSKRVIGDALRADRPLAIVNVASIVGLVASYSNATAYAASKGGILGLTKQIAVTYAGRRIRCNAICPGPIDTPILQSRLQALGRDTFERSVPLRRLGVADDIAQLAVYLASDESSWVTGSLMVIDGGVTAV